MHPLASASAAARAAFSGVLKTPTRHTGVPKRAMQAPWRPVPPTRTQSGRFGIRTGYSCIRTVTGAVRRPGRTRSTAPGNVGFRSLRSRNCRRSPVVRHTGRRGRIGGNPRIRGGQGARNFGGRTGFRNIGRIDAQEFGAAETRRNHDRRDADPQRPVQPAGRL